MKMFHHENFVEALLLHDLWRKLVKNSLSIWTDKQMTFDDQTQVHKGNRTSDDFQEITTQAYDSHCQKFKEFLKF